jgi:transposase
MQSHVGAAELNSTVASAYNCGNRVSWISVGFATPSYQEALPSCPRPAAITRSRLPFDAHPSRSERQQLLRRHLIWLGRLSVVVSIVERLVPDELWELFQRVVPEAPSRPQGGGRRRHGDREVLAAIVFVATSGCTWQQLPSASFGPSGATAHRRFSEWTKARVWAKLHRLVLDELGSRGELDWSRCAIDSVNMRALKRGT